MPEVDGQATDDAFSFDPFAHHQFYIEVNRALVEQTIVYLDQTRAQGESLHIVELASGTGAVTELILNALALHGRSAVLLISA